MVKGVYCRKLLSSSSTHNAQVPSRKIRLVEQLWGGGMLVDGTWGRWVPTSGTSGGWMLMDGTRGRWGSTVGMLMDGT